MTPDQLRNLLTQGEGQHVEFKREFPEQTHALAKEIAAFANSGGGILLMGVEDNGKPIGIPDADRVVERLAGIARGCDPKLSPRIGKFQLSRDIWIVYVDVRHEPLCMYQGKIFIRVASTVQEASSSETMDLVFSTQQSASNSVIESASANNRKPSLSESSIGLVSKQVSKAGEEEIREVRLILTQKPLSDHQQKLFRSLYEAGDNGMTSTQLADQMNVKRQRLPGILGGLGNRVNRTKGIRNPSGVLMLLDAKELNADEWHFVMKPVLRRLLEEENLV